MLLCDAVAQGLIQPLSGADSMVPARPEDKGKKRAEKGIAKAASAYGVFLDPAGLQDVHKALEVCLFVLLCIFLCCSNYKHPDLTIWKLFIRIWRYFHVV